MKTFYIEKVLPVTHYYITKIEAETEQEALDKAIELDGDLSWVQRIERGVEEYPNPDFNIDKEGMSEYEEDEYKTISE